MGPSAIDSEIRSLAPESGGDILLMKNFMEFLEAQLKTRKDFELVEAYLALFLKVNPLYKLSWETDWMGLCMHKAYMPQWHLSGTDMSDMTWQDLTVFQESW